MTLAKSTKRQMENRQREGGKEGRCLCKRGVLHRRVYNRRIEWTQDGDGGDMEKETGLQNVVEELKEWTEDMLCFLAKLVSEIDQGCQVGWSPSVLN